jgi:hypothetical protein
MVLVILAAALVFAVLVLVAVVLLEEVDVTAVTMVYCSLNASVLCFNYNI